MKKRKNNGKYYLIAVVLICIILILISPIMGIKKINVEGNEKFTKEEICKIANANTNDNILQFSTKKAEKDFKKNTYIKDVLVKKDIFKRELNIKILERKISGYVKFNNTTYLYIDKEGRVLEASASFKERHPVIEGLENIQFTIGETLTVDNKEAFKTVVSLSLLFEKFKIEHDVISVDVSDEANIHFYYDEFDIIIGDAKDLDLKIRILQGILEKSEDLKSTGGYIYLNDPPYYRFVPLR